MTEGAGLRLIDALDELAQALVATLDADACIVSRVLGDVLIIVTQASSSGDVLNLGQGFLVSDYPATSAVLEAGVAGALTVTDAGVDDAEAQLLRELGYATLLMSPLVVAGEAWGLVELYRRDAKPFTAAEIAATQRLARIG